MFTSRLLVFSQFTLLICLFLPFNLISTEYGWIFAFVFLSLALKLLLYTSVHNKIGNFNIVPEIKKGCSLITTGPYHYIRHPMYTSVLLLGLGALSYGFAFFKLGLMLALIIVMALKARREEKYWCESSSAYRKYQKKTKMFIPFIL